MSLNLVMLGPPGAGKGTQGERIARERGIPRIATGDILREAVQEETELGRLAKAAMDAGALVDDDVMIGIVGDRLGAGDAEHGFVLDGFPRTVRQAQALDAMMEGRGPLVVIKMSVPHEVLVQRLAGRLTCVRCGTIFSTATIGDRRECERCGGRLVQRSDDDEAVVRHRLEVYLRETKPLVQYYERRATYFRLDGHQPPDQVAADLRKLVDLVPSSRPRPSGVTS